MDLSLFPSSSHTPVMIHHQYGSSSTGYIQKTTLQQLHFQSESDSQHFSPNYCNKWFPCVHPCTFPILHVTARVSFLKHTLDHVTLLLEFSNGSHLTLRKTQILTSSPPDTILSSKSSHGCLSFTRGWLHSLLDRSFSCS